MVEGSSPSRLTTFAMSRRSFRARWELWLARIALAVIPGCSRPTLCRLARIMGSLAWRWGGKRTRKVAEANIALVFPDLPARQREDLLRRSFHAFALSMLDVFWLAKDAQEKLPGLVSIHPSYDPILKPGAMICITAHMGNWEALGMAISLRSGLPLTSVAATLKNSRVDALFNDLRRLTGQHMVPRKGAVRPLLKTLREGGKVALVLDQNTKPVDGGTFVNFMGRPAPMSTAAAMLALRTNAKLVVGISLPTPRGTYETRPLVHISTENLPQPEEAAIQALTQRIADALADAVRENPACWVWSYKRWKIRPPDADASAFPFYSRALKPSDLSRAKRPTNV